LGTLGSAYSGNKDYVRAVAACKRAIQITPTDSNLWVELAGALLEIDENLPAMEACSEAIRLDPENTMAYGHLARYHMKYGNEKLAKETLEKAAQIAKRNAEAKSSIK
jgi:Tfp pilus assembly protein PilF